MDQYTEAGWQLRQSKQWFVDKSNTRPIEPNMMYNIYAIGNSTSGIKITQLDKRDTKGMADIKELQIAIS